MHAGCVQENKYNSFRSQTFGFILRKTFIRGSIPSQHRRVWKITVAHATLQRAPCGFEKNSNCFYFRHMRNNALPTICTRIIDRIKATVSIMNSNMDLMSKVAKGHYFVDPFKLIRGTMPFLADVLNLTPMVEKIKEIRYKDVPTMRGLED